MCDLGSRGLGARTGSHSQLETGAAPGEPNQISTARNFSLSYPGSRDGFRSFGGEQEELGQTHPEELPQAGQEDLGPRQMTPVPPSLPDWSVTRPCWQGEAAPPKCHHGATSPRRLIPRFEAGWEHPCIPWQASREGQQRQCPEAAREGRKEEGTEQRSQTCWGCLAL